MSLKTTYAGIISRGLDFISVFDVGFSNWLRIEVLRILEPCIQNATFICNLIINFKDYISLYKIIYEININKLIIYEININKLI
jgi:hypothetical protein